MSDLSVYGGKGYSRGTDQSREQVNHFTGKMNDGSLINKGRGPTKGNQDYDAGQGSHREPPYSKRDSVSFPKNVDGINAGSQYRGEGGTSVKKPGASAKINVGRGPTKGNQQ